MVKGMTVSILSVGEIQVNLELVPIAYGETSKIAVVADPSKINGDNMNI
jgi:hypothetical protein